MPLHLKNLLKGTMCSIYILKLYNAFFGAIFWSEDSSSWSTWLTQKIPKELNFHSHFHQKTENWKNKTKQQTTKTLNSIKKKIGVKLTMKIEYKIFGESDYKIFIEFSVFLFLCLMFDHTVGNRLRRLKVTSPNHQSIPFSY